MLTKFVSGGSTVILHLFLQKILDFLIVPDVVYVPLGRVLILVDDSSSRARLAMREAG